jgi:hypothetical protein
MQKKGKLDEFSDFEMPEDLKSNFKEFTTVMQQYIKEFNRRPNKPTNEVPLPDDITDAYLERCQYFRLYCEEDLHSYQNQIGSHTQFKTKEKFLKSQPIGPKEFSELRFTSRLV